MGDISKNHAEGSQRVPDTKRSILPGGSRRSLPKEFSERSNSCGLQIGSAFQGSGRDIGGSNRMVTVMIEPTNPMQAGDAKPTTTASSARKILMANHSSSKGINGINCSNPQIQIAPVKPKIEGSSRRILVMKSA
jgi:hypothetical protein